LNCNAIINSNQCINILSETDIDNTCAIYDSGCKTKCEKLNTNECTTDVRKNDCYLLEGSDDGTTTTPPKCINLV
jgi:hypothetical protein